MKRIHLTKRGLNIPPRQKTSETLSKLDAQKRYDFLENTDKKVAVLEVAFTKDMKNYDQGWIDCKPFESRKHLGIMVDTTDYIFTWANNLALDIVRWHGTPEFKEKLDIFFKPYKQNGSHYRSTDGVEMTHNRLIDIACGFVRNRTRDGGYHKITLNQLADLEILFHTAYIVLNMPYNHKNDRIMTKQDVGWNRKLGKDAGENEGLYMLSFREINALAQRQSENFELELDVQNEQFGVVANPVC